MHGRGFRHNLPFCSHHLSLVTSLTASCDREHRANMPCSRLAYEGGDSSSCYTEHQQRREAAYFFCLCMALSVVCLGLFALPAPAQEGPLAGTPAQGTNPNSPSSPPDVVTIAAQGCTVSEGASITLEDPDGTQAQFVDGQLGIEITSTSEQISIVGPDNDYIGDYAFSSSDPGFDTAGTTAW